MDVKETMAEQWMSKKQQWLNNGCQRNNNG